MHNGNTNWATPLGRCRCMSGDRRACSAPPDLDLWLASASKLILLLKGGPLDLLPVFERARQYIGCHFHAPEFYALYLDYLQQHSEYDRSMERRV